MSSTTSTLNYLRPFQPVMYTDGMENRVMEGYRLSLITWKHTEKQAATPGYQRKPAVCVAVPRIALAVEPECLQAAMLEALEKLQDQAVRDCIVSAIEVESGINMQSIVIPQELGTPAGLAASLEVKASVGRLSKSSLEAWFDARIATSLVDAVVANLPAESDPSVSVRQVEKARMAIASLASPRVVMPRKVAEQLQKAINMAPEGDKVKEQLTKKLDFFINPPSAAELELSI